MSNQTTKENFYKHLKIKNYATRSFERFDTCLNHFETYLKTRNKTFTSVSPADVLDYHQYLVAEKPRQGLHQRRPKTIQTYLVSLKVFFRFLAGENFILMDPMEGFTVPRGKGLCKLPQVLSKKEMRRMLTLPSHDRQALRNLALIELLYSSGLRVGEISRLVQSDIDFQNNLVFIRQGKGDKDRVVPLGTQAKLALENYLLKATPSQKEVFLGCRGDPLSKSALAYILKTKARRMGIKKRIYPHLIRHTMATHLLNAGASINIIQGILGHISLESTQVYTHVAPIELKKWYQRCHPQAQWRYEL